MFVLLAAVAAEILEFFPIISGPDERRFGGAVNLGVSFRLT